MLARTRVPADDADQADVLHLRPVPATATTATAAPRPVAARGGTGPVAAAVSVGGAGSARRHRSPTAGHLEGQGRLVQVQGVVAGVPRGHQVVAAGERCCAHRGRREAGGGGAALVWKERERERPLITWQVAGGGLRGRRRFAVEMGKLFIVV